ncbi:MAG: hypothetical protein ACLQVG_02155 [Terriglobia bacterium]
MDVTIIGLDHRVQWKDPTGDLQMLLEGLVRDSRVELIAEEAYKLPTTVGFRLACRANLPWVDIDMNDTERLQAGIDDELKKRRQRPLFDKKMVEVEYLAHADGVREAHWVRQLMQHHVSSALVICDLLHLSPFASKLRDKGCTVKERNVCDEDWYMNRFGPRKVVEENGERWGQFSVE